MRQNTQEAIKRAIEEIYNSVGEKGLTYVAIARESGYSRQTIMKNKAFVDEEVKAIVNPAPRIKGTLRETRVRPALVLDKGDYEDSVTDTAPDLNAAYMLPYTLGRIIDAFKAAWVTETNIGGALTIEQIGEETVYYIEQVTPQFEFKIPNYFPAISDKSLQEYTEIWHRLTSLRPSEAKVIKSLNGIFILNK